MKIIKKIFNKILFAVIVALLFSFINRCNVKALNDPFVSTGTLDFNIITKNSSNNYVTYTRSVDYDFSLLLQNHSSDFENYSYFFITMFNPNGSWDTYNYVIELYFTNNPHFQYGNYADTVTGNFQRYVYKTNYSANSNSIFDSVNTLTTTNQLTSGSRTDIPIYSYYKRVPFYTNWLNSNMNVFPNNGTYMDTTYFLDSTNIPLYNSSYSSPNYYVPVGTAGSWSRSLLFSNYSGGVSAISSTSGAYTTSYNYESYLGETVPTIDYNIDFTTMNSSDNSEEEYGNDLTITGVAVAIKYSPCDNELYNYYYAFVENANDSLDWIQVSDNKCIGSYLSVKNGSLLAKIEDKNNNLLYSKTFNIRNVGTISTFAVNNNKFSTFLTDISSNINYGGPISGLTTIPINLMSTLYNSFNGTCTAYNLGTILGHNVIINCFTLQSILGSSITGVIDMLCAFGIYYHLVLLIISIYRKVMNLDDLDDYLPQHMYHPQHGSYEDLHS